MTFAQWLGQFRKSTIVYEERDGLLVLSVTILVWSKLIGNSVSVSQSVACVAKYKDDQLPVRLVYAVRAIQHHVNQLG